MLQATTHSVSYPLESRTVLMLLKVLSQIILLHKVTGLEGVILQWNMDFPADSLRFSCVHMHFRESICCKDMQRVTEKDC